MRPWAAKLVLEGEPKWMRHFHLCIDCMLIETLEQFRRGKEKTPSSKVGDYFVAFLTGTSFSKHFDKDAAKVF